MIGYREFKHKDLKDHLELSFYTDKKGIPTFTTRPCSFDLAVEEANEWGLII